jgi:hypothetical protein
VAGNGNIHPSLEILCLLGSAASREKVGEADSKYESR